MSCIPKNGNYSSILIKHKFGFSIKKRNTIIKKENKNEITSFQIFYPNYQKPKIDAVQNKNNDDNIQKITALKKNQLMLLNVIKNQEKDLLKTFEEKLNIIYQYSTKLISFLNNTKEKHKIHKNFFQQSILQFNEAHVECNDGHFHEQNKVNNKTFLKIEKIFSSIIYNISGFINNYMLIVQNQEEQFNKYKSE